MNRSDWVSQPGWRTPAAIALAAWLVIEVLLIGQAIHTDSINLWEAIKTTLPRSAMWLFFAPLAVGLVFFFPLERGRLLRGGAAHLAACALLLAGSHHAILSFVASRNQTSVPPSTNAPS